MRLDDVHDRGLTDTSAPQLIAYIDLIATRDVIIKTLVTLSYSLKLLLRVAWYWTMSVAGLKALTCISHILPCESHKQRLPIVSHK